MDDKSIKQIVREELKKLSGMSWGQRLGYIWDYYKPLMAAVVAVIAVISIGISIYHNLQINHIFNVYLVNCDAYSTDVVQISSEFAEYIGGIGALDEITVDSSVSYDPDDTSQYGIAAQMKLVTYIAAGEMDMMIGDDLLYDYYMEADGLTDLTDIFSEEELAAWEDYLVEGTDPEDGTKGIYAVKLNDSPVLNRYPAYSGKNSYAMIPLSAKHQDLAIRFLSYLFGL